MSEQKTPRTWGDGYRCNECCNGDRCDDPTHSERSKCQHCKGTGNAIWKFTELRADLAEAVAALKEIAKPCYLILGPAYADPHNVKAICDGMNARIGIATAVLAKHK